MGIDEDKPRFSWKLASAKHGAAQSAYRIKVRNAEGKTVWDSSKIISDKSLYIEYGGEKLKSSARYFWSVSVWDESGERHGGETWFETGLMNDGKHLWSKAQWIGSPKETTNPSVADTFKISGVFRSKRLGLAVCARNKDDYILFEISDSAVNVYDLSSDGKPYKKPLGSYSVSRAEKSTFALSVRKRFVSLEIDGKTIIGNEDILPQNPVNRPRKAYMASIGFNQQRNKAVIEHLKIETENSVLQEDGFENGLLSALGRYENGSLVIENAFELIYPVGAVNVRKFFEIKEKVKSARLYASARGFYEAYINGAKVGEDFYNPGFTDYRRRIQYQTFDVTDMLRVGANAIGATVGKGHYSGFCGYSGAMIYGTENSFIAALIITYESGETETIPTDGSWRFTGKGPVADSDYFDGQTYDARLEFDQCGKNDGRWIKCGVKPRPENSAAGIFELSAQKGGTAKITDTPEGRFIGESPKGHFVYDIGQNIAGTARIKLHGKRGLSVKIRYGEMTYKDGSVYTENLRSAANTDVYTMKGGNETFVPSFTSHGFRYIDISGNGRAISRDIIESAEGLAVSNISAVTGGFECSNPLINKLQSNIMRGQRSNSLLVLTDCPQRNERMGWTGDAQIFARTGAYNMDMKSFTDKWLADLRDAQEMYNKNGAVPDTAPLGGDNREDGCGGWGDAAVIVPWEMYMAYGDIKELEENYAMMKAWVDYQNRPERRGYGMRTVDGKDAPGQSDLSSIPYIQIQQRRGDHLAFDLSTPYILSATAYAARCADILSETARILGKTGDAEKYGELFKNIKRAFNEAWVKEDGSIAYWGEMSGNIPHIGSARAPDGSVARYTYYSDAESSAHHPSQTAYALAIDFELIDGDKLPRAAQCLKDAIDRNGGKLTVGFLGISHLAPALTKAGLDETAFALLAQEENPSWLYSVKNGATTVWERWDSYIAETGTFGDASMNSFNHYSYGAIGEWMFGRLLGIKPIEAGYKRFSLSPLFTGGLTYAKGFHISPYGTIKSEWKKENGKIIYRCAVPANSEAVLSLPRNEERVLKSGEYRFEIRL